ncbi:hypothetical protein [uncultured Microbacterium sp.]|uniref:hypothetical protein n=1 Tax=uncultured Microbacterium sp. TaxID=191216 RepID=UPI00262FADCC|nr:hypothetical protein [uncultured Microbacterium sp.]
MDVEALAVTKIQGTIALCPHLKAYIASNDKTPFTDGHIDVYRGLGQSKGDWLGRVSVQVKGRTVSGPVPVAPSFRISRTDLVAFQKDGGVFYCLVLVGDDGVCTAYYALLSPFVIEHHIRQVSKTQKSVLVPFQLLPDDAEELEPLMGLALRTKHQLTTLGFDSALFEHTQSITLHSARDLDLTAPLLLIPGEVDFALEMNTEGGLSIPLGGALRIIPQDYVEHESDVVIGSESISYDKVVSRRLNAAAVEFKLDQGLSLTFTSTPGQQQVLINFDAPSNFAARWRATRFLGEMTSSAEIRVNGANVSIGATPDDAWVAGLDAQVNFLGQLDELFGLMAVDSSLVEFDDLDGAQILNLQNLHRALIKGEEPYNEQGELARGLMDIGPWALMILVLPGSEPNRWKYVDPFALAAPQMYRWSADTDEPEDAAPVTAYDIVEQEVLPRVLNLRLDDIVPAYEALLGSPQTTSLANRRVLALISAADASEMREEEFLRAAETLNEWLISVEGELPPHLINRWQILWRRGCLTAAQRRAIHDLKRQISRSDYNMAAEAELSCALLLGDADEIEYLIGQLDDGQLLNVQDWPIWKLRPATSV